MKLSEFSSSISETTSVNCCTLIHWTWRPNKGNFSGHCQRDLQLKLVNWIRKTKATKHLLLLMQFYSPRFSQSTIQKISEKLKVKLKSWSRQLISRSKTLFQAPKNRNNCKSWIKSKKRTNRKLVERIKSHKPKSQLKVSRKISNWHLKFFNFQ